MFRSLVQLDPPEHKQYRDVAAPALTLEAVNGLKPMVAKIAADMSANSARGHPVSISPNISVPLSALKVVLDHHRGARGRPSQDAGADPVAVLPYVDPDLKRPGSDVADPAEVTKTWGIVFEEFEKYYTRC